MNRSEFWATKARLAEYHAVTFEHPSFSTGPIRLVANQFEDVTLGGQAHRALLPGGVTMDLHASLRLASAPTPFAPLVRLGQHVGEKERDLKACMGPVPLHQHEWDAYVSWVYNVGTAAACRQQEHRGGLGMPR